MSMEQGRGASLPEGLWLWRRLYVFASSGGAWLLLERIVKRLPDEAVAPLAQGLMSLLALTMVLYLVAPTAQQLGTSLSQFFGREGR
ncbi:hypothetical protein [Brevundimonas sp. Root1279]|uniref:hypothetical protein n=1 Tax=Brevundimonas sp. Root1279 TaxID=1736443 RepID=UPI000B187E34|nr:hypothetical protein [Brevundimonas sp. Root1279]